MNHPVFCMKQSCTCHHPAGHVMHPLGAHDHSPDWQLKGSCHLQSYQEIHYKKKWVWHVLLACFVGRHLWGMQTNRRISSSTTSIGNSPGLAHLVNIVMHLLLLHWHLVHAVFIFTAILWPQCSNRWDIHVFHHHEGHQAWHLGSFDSCHPCCCVRECFDWCCQ